MDSPDELTPHTLYLILLDLVKMYIGAKHRVIQGSVWDIYLGVSLYRCGQVERKAENH